MHQYTLLLVGPRLFALTPQGADLQASCLELCQVHLRGTYVVKEFRFLHLPTVTKTFILDMVNMTAPGSSIILTGSLHEDCRLSRHNCYKAAAGAWVPGYLFRT